MWKTAWITSTGLRRAALLLTLTCSTAAAQSIAIDRFTIQPPEIAFQGERYLIAARLTVTDRPEGSSTGFIARYIGANIADTVSVGTSGGTLRSIEIRIPRRTCFPSLCADPGPTTVAESLKEVPDRVDLIPVILDAQGGTLASGAATQVPVSKTGDVTITPSSQPLQARQRVRVTMENANFTAGGARVFFRDTRDARGNDPIQTINWSAPSNRRPVCGNMEPLRQVVSCAPEIINDTTFEFTIDSFLLMGDVARYDGRTFDIIASSAAGANVALNAWCFGGQTTAPLPPVMSSISPSNAVIGGPGFTLTVDGSDFAPDAVLLWDLVRLNPRTVTPTKLTADIPASLLQPDPAVAASAKLPRLAVDGGKEVEVRVENPGLSEGAKQVSNALKFFLAPPKEVNRDVIVRNMEIVQSVQTPSNTVPLAAGKRTVVRVYLGLTEGSTPTGEFVDVTLAAFRNREPVPGQPTVIRRSVRPLRFGEEPNRNRISSSAVFELPLSWTEPGSITLAATAHPDDPEAFPNENTANNEFREGFTFAARSSLTVNYYRVCETIKGQLEQRCPDERRISNPSNLDFVQKTFPIPE